jgi:adenine deaminase
MMAGMDLFGRRRDDDEPRRVVVRGRVEEGVEHGSVVLVADPGGPGAATYQLGPAGRHAAGRRADLVAVTRPGMLTTAQQGTPVRVVRLTVVDEARPDDGPPAPSV